MSNSTVSFFFSVVCLRTLDDCKKIDSERRLDGLRTIMPTIVEDLKKPERLKSDKLILKDLNVYVGRPHPGQDVSELPPIGSPNRYGRPIFVGLAEGNIFTKNLKELEAIEREMGHKLMRQWEHKFNLLLHEIFRYNVEVDGQTMPYIEGIPADLENLDPDNPPWGSDHPWYAVWTIFRVPTNDYTFETMGGQGC